MKMKRIPDQSRVRRCPEQFSWVDHRLVRLGHVRGCTAHALALYLVLLTVSDADGVSWYGDERLSLELGFSTDTVHTVRDELIEADLIAYDQPFYQVLQLTNEPVTLARLDNALAQLAARRMR